jgi:hypothetical protein
MPCKWTKPRFAVDITVNLGANWLIVNEWSEGARYQQWTEQQARKLYGAVREAANGVLPWVRVHW